MYPAWLPTVVGSMAAFCTTVAFVPQVVRVWKLKRAEEISRVTFLVFGVGVLVWLVYGIFVASWPIILANAITFVLAVAILVMKWKWDRAPGAAPP
jgi:MtN3 and saliva related transmembrane protein